MRNSKTVSDFDAEAHFRFFGQTLRVKILESTKLTERQRFARQKDQFERLWGLEEEFRRLLIAHAWGPGTYKKFLHYINDERRNILAARPYFRERQTMFTRRISRAIRKGNVLDLYRFRFNFGFMAFALKAYPWGGPGGSARIVKIGKELWELRRQIVEENLPLSINRARIFYGRTPKSHLQLMDEVQACANGMLSAVDKMCPPFTRVFRGVAIGRMVGNMIEDYSATLLHFYPHDKRIIYRANKLVRKFQTPEGVDWEGLCKGVNEGLEKALQTTPSQLALLMAAASPVSSNTLIVRQDGGGYSEEKHMEDTFASPHELRPDVLVEEYETESKLHEGLKGLPMPAKKVLRLKGVEF